MNVDFVTIYKTMNPNGLFTPKAQDTASKQYLSNLKLQQANIYYNLNANRIYKETQQISKLTDTRTADDERLADTESLKRFVREANRICLVSLAFLTISSRFFLFDHLLISL